MTSGIALDDPRFPADADPEKDLKAVAVNLHKGLTTKLETVYGMELAGDVWRPKTLAGIRERDAGVKSFWGGGCRMAAIIIGNLIGAGIYASLWYLIVLGGQKKAKKEKLKELILNTLLSFGPL